MRERPRGSVARWPRLVVMADIAGAPVGSPEVRVALLDQLRKRRKKLMARSRPIPERRNRAGRPCGDEAPPQVACGEIGQKKRWR